MTKQLLLAAALVSLSACASERVAAEGDVQSPAVAIDVAALTLEGVGDVVWDLEVVNGLSQSVWQRRISSSGFGDGAGSASYVGPCDAASDAADNTVRVWVVGLYSAAVSATGSFASGDPAGVSGAALPFENPTSVGAAGALTRAFECLENEDVAVSFDVSLMRPAQQGFFDVAVNFNEIFCSAKFDCCDDADDSGACGAGEDIELLFGTGGARDRTMVLGFACTAGVAASANTTLYMDALELDCTDPASGFSADVIVSPGLASPGNQCAVGDVSSCPAVTEVGGQDADTWLYQVAVFRGDEQLTTGGGPAHKAYWNVALGVTDAICACELRTRATADDAADAGDNFVDGFVSQGAVYPYIDWNVSLATCAEEPLTFSAGASVRPDYTRTDATESAYFGFYFAPGLPAGSILGASCLDLRDRGVTVSGLYTLDPNGGDPSDAFVAWCDMETDGGGWTMCWSDDEAVIMEDETTYSEASPFGTDGYRSDCGDIPFTDVLYVNHDAAIPAESKAWFTKDAPGAIVASDAWVRDGSAFGTFTSHGFADATFPYQLTICGNASSWMWVGLMMTGLTQNYSTGVPDCYKACNNWCHDTTSAYFRPDGDYIGSANYDGSAFNENGHYPNNPGAKLLSVGIR